MPAPAVRRLALAGAPAVLVCALATAPAAALPQVPVVPHTTAAAATGSLPGPEVRGPAARAGGAELELAPVSWVSEGWASSLVDPEQAALAGVGLVLAGLVGAFGVGLSRRPEPVD